MKYQNNNNSNEQPMYVSINEKEFALRANIFQGFIRGELRMFVIMKYYT